MKLTYIGHSAFRIEIAGAVILLDPFITGNPAARTDVKAMSAGVTHVLLTHGHDDHVGDALDILKSTGATLVSNFEVCSWLAGQGVENYSPGNHGGRISFDAFDVIFTNAWHSSSHVENGRPLYLGNPAGFVIEPRREKARTIYAMGDTGITLDMKLVNDLYQPKIGLVPIGDRFTMGPDQAAYACRNFFAFDTIIPCHYASFEGFVIPTAEPFVKAMGDQASRVKVLSGGQSIEL